MERAPLRVRCGVRIRPASRSDTGPAAPGGRDHLSRRDPLRPPTARRESALSANFCLDGGRAIRITDASLASVRVEAEGADSMPSGAMEASAVAGTTPRSGHPASAPSRLNRSQCFDYRTVRPLPRSPPAPAASPTPCSSPCTARSRKACPDVLLQQRPAPLSSLQHHRNQ